MKMSLYGGQKRQKYIKSPPYKDKSYHEIFVLSGNEKGENMQDIKLWQTCDWCGAHLTLMESIRLDDSQQLCLVIRCLTCGRHPVEEVAEIK